MKQKKKAILVVLSLLLFQGIIYFLTKLIQGPANMLETELDNKIPFIPFFVYFYISWYFLIFFVPCRIYQKNKNTFYRYITTTIISLIISGIIFVIYPTTVLRPNIQDDSFTNIILNLIYKADTPLINCLPSIHCLMAFLIAEVVNKIDISRIEKIFVTILSLLIILSTLFIKQHVLYDIIFAFIIMECVWYFVQKYKIEKMLMNKIEKNNESI